VNYSPEGLLEHPWQGLDGILMPLDPAFAVAYGEIREHITKFATLPI
jgi:hypothetical protein